MPKALVSAPVACWATMLGQVVREGLLPFSAFGWSRVYSPPADPEIDDFCGVISGLPRPETNQKRGGDSRPTLSGGLGAGRGRFLSQNQRFLFEIDFLDHSRDPGMPANRAYPRRG